MRAYGAWDSRRPVETRGFNRASCRASTDRSFWATLPRGRMRPSTFVDVDNCGNVDMRCRHMGLDKPRGERDDPRTLGVRPRGERVSTEGVANNPGDRREGCVSRG